jgi:hypothetical protein
MITYAVFIQVEETGATGLRLLAAHVAETKLLSERKVGVRFLHKARDVLAVLEGTATMLRQADSKGVIIPG